MTPAGNLEPVWGYYDPCIIPIYTPKGLPLVSRKTLNPGIRNNDSRKKHGQPLFAHFTAAARARGLTGGGCGLRVYQKSGST